ncbi:MAG TPA: efflux RND transporter periplasmic adaptor subunit, partial [Rhizobiaceae bacterium]|nr:efflux RND transporter periplasmic adaptor subunit [Rhizobiaceae bacterium]
MDQIVNRPKAETPDGIEAALGLDMKYGRQRGRRGFYLLTILVVAAAAAVAAYLSLSGSGAETVYTTTPVERGAMTVQVSATGTLEPLTQVDISSELSGVIRSVPVEENQRVAKGDVLAELDTTRLAAQVERAEASVKAAAANVTEAKVTLSETNRALARSEQLASRGMIADQALETARAARDRAASAVETAEANLAVAEADLKLQQADLVKSNIYAPVDGIVLSRDADPGQTVASSFQAPVLFVIAEDLERMELVAAIDEADIGTVAKGQDAEFTVDAFPGRRFEAAISDISYASTTTEGVVTYEARLAVDNDDLLLRPGMTATVSIVTRHAEDILLVPNEAFRYSPPVVEEDRGFG